MGNFTTKILLATDGSAEAESAARSAADLAQKTGSELHVVHVGQAMLSYHPERHAYRTQHERDEKEAGQLLQAQVERMGATGATVAQAHLRMGEPAREIVRQAEDMGAGLVVVGGRGRGGVRRALMGSVSDSVVRHAPCPVLVVRGEPVAFPTKILLATDGSEDANLASAAAADLSRVTGSELHVVRVGHTHIVLIESPGAIDPVLKIQVEQEEAAEEATRTELEEQVRKIREAGGEIAEAHARVGRPDAEIVELAEGLRAGLIVVGSRGLGSVGKVLMGSVSDSVVRHAHCPVMVVRH